MMDKNERVCPFCKQVGEHVFGKNPCEAMKKHYQWIDERTREMRRVAMEEEREWPPKEYLVKKWRAHGLDCAVVRGEVALCGYVRVPPGHPDENHYYDDVEDVNVHGGITFTCKAKDGGRWFGFDCAHFMDWFGCYDPEKKYGFERPGRIWTVEDVVRETEEFARQLAVKGAKGGKVQA